MLSSFETGAETLPCVVKLSGAYAAGETTAREYNAALRVAVLEDAVKRPFCEATWSKVLVGDIVLMPWPTGRKIEIAKVKIEGVVTEPGLNGELLVIARFIFGGLHYGQAFSSEDVAYVQSRL